MANLEDTVNGRRIWAQEFTGVLGDLLTLEDGIFAQLLTALSITPGSDERNRTASRATQSIEAYDLYLRGRNGMRGQNDPKNVQAAITSYEQALTKDPRFALAFAGLADAYLSKYSDTRISSGPTRLCSRLSRRSGSTRSSSRFSSRWARLT